MINKGQIAVMGIFALIAVSGVVGPVEYAQGGVQSEIDTLNAELDAHADLQMQLKKAAQRVRDLERMIEERPVSLLPDTPAAHQAFESKLLEAVDSSGVNSVRLDRRDAMREGDLMYLKYEQQLEGDAAQIHAFLHQIDVMPWVTRVMSLAIEAGDDVRRMTLEVAVVLEPKS